MEEEKKTAEQWVDDTANLIETYRDLITIRFIEQTSLGASWSILGIISLILILCTFLFVGLGFAWWVGESMNDRAAGFMVVAGVYFALLFILLVIARRFIIPAIRNLIIKKIYDTN